MKKVVNVSIDGKSFSLNDDAYRRLKAYLEHFKAKLALNNTEAMDDIEQRISELFQQEVGLGSRVVDLPLVEKVVKQLGMPDGSPEPTDSADEQRESFADQERKDYGKNFEYFGETGNARRKLYRDTEDKKIAGVCSGLAAYLNIDTTLIRIILLVLLICAGGGFWIYVVIWIVAPEAKTPAEKCEMRGLPVTAENMAKFTQSR